jgi:hypothetical protein
MFRVNYLSNKYAKTKHFICFLGFSLLFLLLFLSCQLHPLRSNALPVGLTSVIYAASYASVGYSVQLGCLITYIYIPYLFITFTFTSFFIFHLSFLMLYILTHPSSIYTSLHNVRVVMRYEIWDMRCNISQLHYAFLYEHAWPVIPGTESHDLQCHTRHFILYSLLHSLIIFVNNTGRH